jgi:hypothetical protein
MLNLRTLKAEGVQRINLRNTPPAGNQGKEDLESPLGLQAFQSYAFVAVPFTANIEVKTARARVTAKVQSLLKFAERERHLESRIQLDIQDRPLYEAGLYIPEALNIEQITAPGIFEWAITRDGDRRRLTVYFAEGMKGITPVVLRGRLGERTATNRVDIPRLEVLNVVDQSGDIAVQTDPAFELQTGALTHIEPILKKRVYGWLQSAQRPLTRLALHYTRPDYRGELRLTARKPNVTGYSLTNIRVTDRSVEETILLNFTIRDAGIRSLVFTLPAHLAEARIHVPLLRQKTVTPMDGDRVRFTLDLQDEVMNELRVLIEQDRLLTGDGVRVRLPELLTGRTDRRYAALENAGRDEVVIAEQTGLDKLDRQQKEWNTVAEFFKGGASETYITQPGAEDPGFTFSLRQRKAVETAGARIGLARAILLLDAHGAYRGQQTYYVDNQTEQFLSINLPVKAELWTARVAGDLVKPIVPDPANAQHVQIPLVKTAAGDLDYTVVLKYGGRVQPATLVSPMTFPLIRSANIGVEQSQVELRLPRTHDWLHFDGTMRQVMDQGDFQAGELAYLVNKAKTLSQTLQFGDVFSRARAEYNLKSIQVDLESSRDAYSTNNWNPTLQTELSNAGATIQDTREQLRANEKEKAAPDNLSYGNRGRFNKNFEGQDNTFARNQVIQNGSNWEATDILTGKSAQVKKQFNDAWFFNNALTQKGKKKEQVAYQRIQSDTELLQKQNAQGWGQQAVQGGYTLNINEYVSDNMPEKPTQQKLIGIGKRQQAIGQPHQEQALQRSRKARADRYQRRLVEQEEQAQTTYRQKQSTYGIFGMDEADQDGESHQVVRDPFGEAPGDDKSIEGVSSIGGGISFGDDDGVFSQGSATGLASLDFRLPGSDNARWQTLRFTTPRGDVTITARAASTQLVEGLKRLAVVLVALLLLSQIHRLASRRHMSDRGRRTIRIGLILFGVIGLLLGLLPLAALCALVAGILLGVVESRKRRYA